tara:strand:- start:243 stop:416 length:174 start_codon:yes stop_codon:yes gene_type:complete
MEKPHSLEVVRYEYDGENIVIKMIKLLDENGKYIKFVKLKEVTPHLSQYNVKFKKIK